MIFLSLQGCIHGVFAKPPPNPQPFSRPPRPPKVAKNQFLDNNTSPRIHIKKGKTMSKPGFTPPYNVEEIKKEAAQSISDGAVTEDYPLDIDNACEMLNEALATEILCVLRYRHHQIIAKSIDFPQVAAEFKEHAEDEERHMLMIAERIKQLGGNPDFNPATIAARTATEYGKGETLVEMIKEDLIAERIVISIYRKLIAWFDKDYTTRRMLEEILEDEEEHADDLSDLLAK
jgi:bacterioferritin